MNWLLVKEAYLATFSLIKVDGKVLNLESIIFEHFKLNDKQFANS